MVDQERRTLDRAERVLVDGNNLVGGWDDQRLRAAEAALRRLLPSRIVLEIFRDGGGTSADDRIIAAIGRPDPGRADRIVVITDDRELRLRVAALGASTIPARTMRERIDAHEGHPGATHPATRSRSAPSLPQKDDEPEVPRWRPGRGATKKRGPSTRPPRAR